VRAIEELREVARRVDAQASSVLIVDDSADLRELIGEVLETAGYAVTGAEDGAKALRLLRCGLNPRLILLDRNIPVLDGPELLQKAHGLLSGVAVVWMTGEDHDVSHPSVVATLRKPFDLDDVVRVVQVHCQRRPA
jgi:CheY-like chemotaxis protein